VTKRSGCPGGHRAETLQPWRRNEIARRAEEGHHKVAQIKIFGWEFPSNKPTLYVFEPLSQVKAIEMFATPLYSKDTLPRRD
jgi:hypothetical protein